MDLKKYGFDDYFEKEFKEYEEKGFKPARVFMEEKGVYKLYTEIGEVTAKVSGKFQYEAVSNEKFPAAIDIYGLSDLEQIASGFSKEIQELHKSEGTPEALIKAGANSTHYVIKGANHGGIYWAQPKLVKIIIEFLDEVLKK